MLAKTTSNEVVDLLDDPVGVEQNEPPVEHLPEEGVLEAHDFSNESLLYTGSSFAVLRLGL